MSLNFVAFLVILALGAAAAGWLLRRIGLSGGSVVGGVMVGVLLGPTIAGRVAPDFFEMHIIGGRTEREALTSAQRAHGSNRLARAHANTDQQFTADAEQEEQLHEAELAAALDAARRAHRLPLTTLVVVCVCLFFLCSPMMCGSPRRGEPPDWYAALSIGLWSAFVPAAALFGLLRLIGYEVIASAAAAGTIAVGATMLRSADIDAAEEAETGGARLIKAAAAVASVAALLAIGWTVLQTDSAVHHMLYAAMALSLVCGWILARARRDWASIVVDGAILPILAALVAFRIEVIEDFRLWPTLFALLLSGDGRWFGAYLGAVLSSARKSLRAMRLVLGAMGAGTAQIALIAACMSMEILSAPLAYALLLGAVVMELTTRARSRVAAELRRTEEVLDASLDEDDGSH